MRTEVLLVIDQLLSGELSREAASAWASERHLEVHPDPAVEEALDVLTLIDAREVSDALQPLHYLYDLEEVSAVRDALTR